MKIAVLMSSGDEDTWEDVEDAYTDMDDAACLVVLGKGTQTGEDLPVVAKYAPGMWMRVTYEEDTTP